MALLLWGGLCADTIRIRSGVWEPFHGVAGSPQPGIIIEIASNAFQKAGHRLDYQNLPWSCSIDLARSGEIDGVVGASIPNVPDFVFPKNEQAMNVNVFYTRKGNPWRYEGLPSLAGKRVGIIQDYLFTEDFDAYVRKNKGNGDLIQIVAGMDALRQNLLKLENRRIDAYLDDRLVIEHFLMKSGRAGLFQEAGAIGRVPIFMAFSPARPQSRAYAAILSAAMETMRESGELARLLARYHTVDWR
ncbi:MAG: transporter substrate-binding domain-containing protein [Spirochaetes bacterium]|nr:transporter substrate-binding domain-containing protein [Spirochaetota bacterium]